MWDTLNNWTKALATTHFWACSPPPSNFCGIGPPSKLWPRKTTCGFSDEGIAPVEVNRFRDPLQTQHLKPLSKIDAQDLIPKCLEVTVDYGLLTLLSMTCYGKFLIHNHTNS
eukprot:2397216-Amphidinium_carterae.1